MKKSSLYKKLIGGIGALLWVLLFPITIPVSFLFRIEHVYRRANWEVIFDRLRAYGRNLNGWGYEIDDDETE